MPPTSGRRPPNRPRHPAQRARRIAGGIAATAAVGLAIELAVVAPGSASASSTNTGTSSANAATSPNPNAYGPYNPYGESPSTTTPSRNRTAVPTYPQSNYRTYSRPLTRSHAS